MADYLVKTRARYTVADTGRARWTRWLTQSRHPTYREASRAAYTKAAWATYQVAVFYDRAALWRGGRERDVVGREAARRWHRATMARRRRAPLRGGLTAAAAGVH